MMRAPLCYPTLSTVRVCVWWCGGEGYACDTQSDFPSDSLLLRRL